MIPKDPYILLSYVNTQLRDNYTDLDKLCDNLGVEKDDLIENLGKIGYIYNPELNQFK